MDRIVIEMMQPLKIILLELSIAEFNGKCVWKFNRSIELY